MATGLLSNVYYGDEIDQFHLGTAQIRQWFSDERIGESVDWGFIEIATKEFFSPCYDGVFGGQITAGDGISIMAFMAAIRPVAMIEIGVASGFSSAWILQTAKKLGLLSRRKYLFSFDLVAKTAAGLETGSFARSQFPQLIHHWHLNTEVTSLDLIRSDQRYIPDYVRAGPTVAFIDGAHSHPWPLVDIIAMRNLLPKGSWLVLQDAQMMERWIADVVIFQVASPAPIRGVNLVVTLWPGLKQIGMGLNYNTTAICLDISDKDFETFVRRCMSYPDEIQFGGRDVLLANSTSAATESAATIPG
jgi:cephalosporin hydroxylase